MYKVLAVVLLAAVAANAVAIAPLVSGLSHTQRVQSHIPIGAVGYGVPLLGKGLVGGYGLGGVGLGLGGVGLAHGGIGLAHGVGLGHGLGLGYAGLGHGYALGHGYGLGGLGVIG